VAAWRRFGDPDFQFALRDEILRQTQGEHESVADYLTYMQALFDRLSPPWSLAEQLNYRNSKRGHIARECGEDRHLYCYRCEVGRYHKNVSDVFGKRGGESLWRGSLIDFILEKILEIF